MFSKNDVPLTYNWRFKLGLHFLINRALCILVWNSDLHCAISKNYLNQI